MNGIDDVPKYIRYDFFMALFGMITVYFLFTNDKVYNNPILYLLFATVSGTCILYGLTEMKRNYEFEKNEIRKKAYNYQKIRLPPVKYTGGK